jgi:hypothetical protein
MVEIVIDHRAAGGWLLPDLIARIGRNIRSLVENGQGGVNLCLAPLVGLQRLQEAAALGDDAGHMRDPVPEPAPSAPLHHVPMDDGQGAVASDDIGIVEFDLIGKLAVLGNGHRDHRSSHGVHQNPSSQSAHSR